MNPEIIKAGLSIATDSVDAELVATWFIESVKNKMANARLSYMLSAMFAALAYKCRDYSAPMLNELTSKMIGSWLNTYGFLSLDIFKTSNNPNGTITYSADCSADGCATEPSSPSGAAAVATTAAGGSNVKDVQQYYAAAYDFGILKAYAQYINRKVTSELDSSLYATRTAQQIGVRGFFTPKIEGWASAGNGQLKAFSNSAPTANFVGYQLGSNYWLSKRTNLYAIYGQVGTSNVSTTLNANPASFNASNYALGVRHTF
jgi:predicted porin